jgi:ubiquitin-like 1-activating enzyme E1 B
VVFNNFYFSFSFHLHRRLKDKTECYECSPKPTPKQYAYCTIRSFPKEPIHCIVWAREEFSTFFGSQQQLLSEDLPKDESKLKFLKENVQTPTQ